MKVTITTTNRAKIQEVERTIQALKRLQVFLEDRPLIHQKAGAMIRQQEQSARILKRSIVLHENMNRGTFLATEGQYPAHQDAPTSDDTSFLEATTTRIPSLNTPEERRQDVAALKAILPTIQDRHAKLLVLALKLQLEAEIASQQETSEN